MSLTQTPYVGTWKIDGKKLVQHTPDALVYLNGDTSLPGCPKCHRRIDLQQFLTEVSVDAGIDPQSASATFTLSIPVHHTDSFARDAKFILRPGLEIHVYMRGYFPVEGMFEPLSKPTVEAEVVAATKESDVGPAQSNKDLPLSSDGTPAFPVSSFLGRGENEADLTQEQRANLTSLGQNMETFQQYLGALASEGQLPYYGGGDVQLVFRDAFAKEGDGIHVEGSAHYAGNAVDLKAYYTGTDGNRRQVDRTVTWAALRTLRDAGYMEKGGVGAYLAAKPNTNAPSENHSDFTVSARWSREPHYDRNGGEGGRHPGRSVSYTWWDVKDENGKTVQTLTGGDSKLPPELTKTLSGMPAPSNFDGVRRWNQHNVNPPQTMAEVVQPTAPGPPAEATSTDPPERARQPKLGPSLLDSMGLGDTGIDEVIAYPYYHVFHGVTTSVTFNYASGVNTISVSCNSLLHFWGFQQISDNASFLGARPTNSKLKMSLVGSNFTGKHPYQVMWELYSDIGGAAAGVGWALRQAGNQDALAFNGESLFSLTLNYWENRFKGKMNQLRLHGATGRLLSNAQAAFLSRLPTTDLMRRLKDAHSLAMRNPKQENEPFEKSWALWLNSLATLEAVILAQQGAPAPDSTQEQKLLEQGKASNLEINIAENEPWPMDLGKLGQVETFESTYVSKLDVATKCMEIIGFEFYQDVDGDFVFKPPMYNLDTSASRVYRIEDIDIITINFSEKEPQATYIIAKGQHFRNWVGTGLENEWGVEGRYIDYRLVAQFGWRQATLESAYYNDPKSLFFAGVNRLDILNAQVNSATVTIPLRPEIRPGYPVFIPYLDCYYYCPSFAHSFSVGGQCQTNLQLVAKRAKFYAPGRPDPNIGGIDAIELSNPNLPERPLEVIGEDGRPRLSGFPNVVMALDPTHLNPLFWLIGTDIEDLGSPQVIQNLLDQAVQLNQLKKDPTTGDYLMESSVASSSTGSSSQSVLFSVQGENSPKSKKAVGDGPTRVDAVEAGRDYMKDLRERGERVSVLEAELRVLDAQIAKVEQKIPLYKPGPQQEALFALLNGKPAGRDKSKAEKQAEGTAATPTEEKAKRKSAQKAQEGLFAKRKQLKAEIDKLVTGQGETNAKNTGLTYLINLINRTGAAFKAKSNDGAFGSFTDLTSTANLLDLLSEKKAVFSNGQQPGYYRYYSASHPDKEQQGQKFMRQSAETKTISLSDPVLDQVATTTGYVKTPTATFPNGKRPEAELAESQPVTWGIRVNTFNKPGGETIPTSSVKEIMFARHEAGLKRPLTNNKKGEVPKVKVSQDAALRAGFNLASIGKNGRIEPSDTIEGVFKRAWETKAGYLTEARKTVVTTMKAALVNESIPSITVPPFPTDITIRKIRIDVKAPMSIYYGDNGGATSDDSEAVQTVFPSSVDLMSGAGAELGSWMVRAVSSAKRSWIASLQESVTRPVDQEKAVVAFDLAFASKLGAQSLSADKTKTKSEFRYDLVFESPVFPISDEKGYCVFGSYRYGRGIDIDPSGAWDVIHRQDPSSMLSRKLVENVIKVFVDGESRIEYIEETTQNGVVKLQPRTSTTRQEAITGLEKQAQRELKERNITNRDLQNMGLAKATGNPDMLEFSLLNFVPTKESDALMKVPLVNAAYSLADLTQAPLGDVCSCKAAEASIQLEAFGQAGFVQILDPSTVSQASQESPDPMTQWLGQVTAEKVDSWRESQEALRGTVLDNRGSNFLQSFLGLGQTAAALENITEDAKRAASEASFKFEQAKALIKNPTGGGNG